MWGVALIKRLVRADQSGALKRSGLSLRVGEAVGAPSARERPLIAPPGIAGPGSGSFCHLPSSRVLEHSASPPHQHLGSCSAVAISGPGPLVSVSFIVCCALAASLFLISSTLHLSSQSTSPRVSARLCTAFDCLVVPLRPIACYLRSVVPPAARDKTS